MILLVEDEAISRYAFAQVLRLHGHEVMEAADGVKALTLLAMPCLDGFALVTRIREKSLNLPIVLLSGYTAQYAAAAVDGSTEFLSKPIDPSALIATVQRLLPQPVSEANGKIPATLMPSL